MAAKKKKKEKVMVLHDEGAAAPTAVPMASPPPAPFVVFKPGQAIEEQGILVTKEEVNINTKYNRGLAKTLVKVSATPKTIIKVSATPPSIKSAAKSNAQLENLPPDRTCKGVKVTLDNNNMWNEFYRSKTEMILTKQGCRMFPYCRFRISGLEPFQKYALLMDIHQVDNKQYKWTGQDWQANGKAEADIQRRPFIHSESPNSGHYWMQNPVSFYKLKLTNNTADQEGNVVLHTSHRYLPRLHLVLADKVPEDVQLDGPDIITFTFPQTEFFAVTSYQNARFTQLKVDYNPFAKGLREDGPSPFALKLKTNPLNASKKDEARSSKELNPVKSLKSLLANNKPKNTKAVNQGLKMPEVQNVTSTPANKGASGSSESTEENSSSNTCPPTRNFSELIRESHVKLRRCHLEKTTTTYTIRLTEADSLVPKDGVEEVAAKEVMPDIAQAKGPSAKTVKKTAIQESAMSTKGEQNRILPSPSKKPVQRIPQAAINQHETAENSQKDSLGSSINSEPQRTSSDGQTLEKVKPHKRPAPVPLPALALYLQQLRSKSSPARAKPTSPSVMPSMSSPQLTMTSTSPYRSQSPHVAAPLDDQKADPSSPNTHPDGKASNSVSGSTFCPVSQASDPVLAAEATDPTSQPLGPTTELSHPNVDGPVPATTTETQTPVPDPLPETGPVLPSSYQSLKALSPPLPLSPFLPETVMSSAPNPMLPSPDSAQELSYTVSATTLLPVQELRPHLPATMKYGPPDSQSHISDLSSHSPALSSLSSIATSKPPTDPSLPGPENISCGLEPLPPGWLQDPEPSLLSPAQAPLLLPPTSSTETLGPLLAPGVHVAGLESSMSGHGQSSGVFVPITKMSSSIPVLPPPDPFLTSFTSFLPTLHSAPMAIGSSSVFSTSHSSLSFSHPGPLDLASVSSFPPPDPDTFQVNDQSLPFPATLSPLALPLSLSPSFSSLGPDPLSPTPSFSDLVHFFANSDDLEIDEDFPNHEPVPPVSCTSSIETPSIPVLTQPMLGNKPRKLKGKSRKRKFDKTRKVPVLSVPADVKLQPNLEEVEEQLFVSFTSKEALEIHIGDSTPAPQIVEAPPQKTSETTTNVECTETLEEQIAALKEVLLTDLKFKKHRQVIHPVLQEVGLKMSLLDPTLAIDLQYLGVRLPIPPPFSAPEQSCEGPATSPSSSAVFVSRTGKTNDVTQIKGWREKFVHSESSSSSSSSKPEVAPSSDGTMSKNLSAFCSDMLDEYLANEGKLIDERAASFSQTVVSPVVYKLPTKSTSYVRTLSSVLKKQTLGPTSSIISDFIPPSKRPKLPPMKHRKTRMNDKEQKQGSKQSKTKPLEASSAALTPTSAPKPALTPPPSVSQSDPSEHTAPITHSPNDSVQKKKKLKDSSAPSEDTVSITQTPNDSVQKKMKKKKKILKDSSAPSEDTAPITHSPKDSVQKKKRKKKKPKDSLTEAPPGASADMAPLESDSELGPAPETRPFPDSNRLMTKGMLKQKDLENGVTWEGKHRTYITEERAEVALSSLFTLAGFVCENPTAAVRIIKCRAPPCLNVFCRLGCVCSSLARERRITHCGKTECIFGCSCLRQKVVLLKNLEGQDSSASDEGLTKKKRRTKRMRMAYALKEAESVSQPAQRVRTLWKQTDGDIDPEPVHKPTPICLPAPPARLDPADKSMTCARVRVLKRKRKEKEKENEKVKEKEKKKMKKKKKKKKREEKEQSKPATQKDHVSQPKLADPASASHPKIAAQKPSPDPLPSSELSKRLEIVSECRWKSRLDRNLILRVVCEHMALDRLTDTFWVKGYLIRPLSQGLTLEGEGYAITYKVHISQVAEPPSGVQVVEEEEEEEDGLEDWQREIDEDMMEEGEEAAAQKEEGELGTSEQETNEEKKRKGLKYQGLPFITGISQVGVLTANRKQPGGSDQGLVQVNGKSYPSAKIQLGQMGAMHPANRLAAYLTGRLRVVSQELVKLDSASSSSTSSSSATSTSPPSALVLSAPQPTQSATSAIGPASEAPGPAVPVDSGALQATADGKDVPVITAKTSPGGGGGRGGGGEGGEGGEGGGAVAGAGAGEGAAGAAAAAAAAGAAGAGAAGAGEGAAAGAAGAAGVGAAGAVAAAGVGAAGAAAGAAVPIRTKLIVPVPGTNTVQTVQMACSASKPLAPLTPSQRMVLQPVRSSTGATVYRTPQGQLIQLVPLSKLQALNPNLVVQKGGSLTFSHKPVFSTTASSSASPHNSAPPTGQFLLTVTSSPVPPLHSSKATPVPPPSVSISTALPNVSVLSSSQPLTLRPITLPGSSPRTVQCTAPPLDFLAQKGTTTLKIIPSVGQKDQILYTQHPSQGFVKAMPGSFTLLKPPPSLVAPKPIKVTESGVKALTVSTATASQPPTTPSHIGPNDSGALNTPGTSSEASSMDQDVIRIVIGEDAIRLGEDVIRFGEETGKWTEKREKGDGRRRKEVDVVDSDSDVDVDTESDETEDSEVDTPACPLKLLDKKIQHNVLERWRRAELMLRFQQLREELELSDKSSKVYILDQAKEEIRILQRKSRRLEKQMASLLNRRSESLKAVSQLTAESGEAILEKIQNECANEKSIEESSRGAGETKSRHFLEGSEKPSLVQEVTEVVSLLDDTEEETDNSSDEEKPEEAQVVHIISDEEEVVSVETDTVLEHVDPQKCSSGVLPTSQETTPNTQGEDKKNRKEYATEYFKQRQQKYIASYRALKQVLDLTGKRPTQSVLNQACKEIQKLTDKCMMLEKLKVSLNQTRTGYLAQVSFLSGKAEDRRACSTLKTQEDLSKRAHTPPPVGPAPPVLPKRVAPQARPDSDRPRTVPNILSRRKPPTPPPASIQKEDEPQSLHTTLLPMGLIPMMIPGQQVITTTPLHAPGSSLLHPVCLSGLGLHPSTTPGVASVTISIPGLSQQPIQVKAPPLSLNSTTGNTFSSAALYTTTTNPSGLSVLSLVTAPPQPAAQSQLQNQAHVQVTAMAKNHTPGTPLPAPPAQGAEQTIASTTEYVEISSDDGESEDESLKVLLDEIIMLNRQMSGEDPGRPAALPGGPPSEAVEGGAGAWGGESAALRAGDDERSLSPLFLSLDDDPSRAGGDKEKASGGASQPLGQSGQEGSGGNSDPQPGSAWHSVSASRSGSGSVPGPGPLPVMNGHSQEQSPPPPPPGAATKRGGMTPPPLLQMKAGGAAETPASAIESVVERKGAEVAWRPMPKLAPLGLKTTHSPSASHPPLPPTD